MFKEDLPINCPPESAENLNVEIYRILNAEEPTEDDFQPYVKLYPENKRYEKLCKAHALSSFDSLENAKSARNRAKSRGRELGDYIGKFQLSEKDGLNEYTPKTGHYSTWLYSNVEYDKFECETIIEVNGN